MPSPVDGSGVLEPETHQFYVRTMQLLNDAQAPYLVGGAYALGRYTGIHRHTKDFDIFVRREDYDRTMEVLGGDGCTTELTFPHWLGKAICVHGFVDVIFSSGNGIASVDEEWFEHAVDGEVLGMPVKLCPAEEIIWSKSFIMERERFDGADIQHLLLARGPQLDWKRLLRRFGAEHWRVLFSHLTMFGFVYPSRRERIPAWVMNELMDHMQREMREPPPEDQVCRGTILSREQYLIDVRQWDYQDGRLALPGTMTAEQIQHWTAAIEAHK